MHVPASSGPVAPAPPRLLVVEDDPLLRSVCVRLLKKKAYDVDQVENGLHALQRLDEAAYDIVLTDLSMPVMNGLSLLSQMRTRFPHTDAIMITAYGSIETAKQALKLGAFDYLTKPLEFDDLERTVQTCLEMRELKRLRQEHETLSEMVDLLELSRTISARLDVDTQVRGFVSQLRKRFKPSRIALSLLDPHAHTLMLLAPSDTADQPRTIALPTHLDEAQIVQAHTRLIDQIGVRQRLEVLRVQERPVGVLDLAWPDDAPPLNDKDAQLFEVFVASMAVALENGRLYSKLKYQNVQTIASLAAAIDARDTHTRGHSEQVTKYAVRMAQSLGWSDARVECLRYGALLHDVGKIGVPDAILLKPGRLTDDEFEVMKKHPAMGARIVEAVLNEVRPIIRHHHERYDGTGYPDRLAGEAIPLEARIVAVADAFDAMTSDRSYRRGMSVANALTILRGGRNTQWQAELVDVLIDLVEREGETLLDGKDRMFEPVFLRSDQPELI